MFNWFDKLLVKIAKKILNKYAPTGEFIAYINEQEEKVLKDLGGYGQPVNETGVKSFLNILDWIETAQEYEPLIKTGVAALGTYASYKDQKKKNQMQQQAYDDYMRQVDAAGQEARAAIDINYTPMTVSGVPQTKADVTDFTAVAARGGLMSVPNKQRKRYYAGTGEEEVMEIDTESITPFGLQQETGIPLTDEQVFHDSGDDRTNAQNVWQSGQIDQQIYDMNFEIFFNSRDWEDHISQAPAATGDMQMASADPLLQDEYDKYVFELQEIQPDATPMSIEDFRNQAVAGQANGGIIGLRHGGRPGYSIGPGPVMDRETIAQSITLPDGGEEVVTDTNSMEEIKGQTAGPDWYIKRIEHLEFLFGDELTEDEIADIAYDSDKYYEKIGGYAQGGRIGFKTGTQKDFNKFLNERKEGMKHQDLDRLMEEYKQWYRKQGGPEVKEAAQGGRIGYAQGSGIMNLGGMEKDYRTTGGFVPIGAYEKKDDVPARLSKNEFVMTADAVRAAGGGSINKGAQLMYDTMKHLEAQPQAQRMTV